ncbi:L-seryl-tRNA(Sec) selenium transferase [[Mannheimia] succiniciproducens]|uniref:L-seryl-tRNA(Sec) selenium transferase n=1 Tax=Mannheimia succiniciproducens (strain KCTC 0769BP / MBEL55E) TaxID=221988 RepID=SELA_MANSM|nr:L-seryl-tRNA(Sec) selenium transferase [[Mannheimia] succiniciproducens]Q65Q15.1 RecName: Full=L-seryl-tRNA(Sec) selenium transferase; AltName: Full=Selenocysteine synthase; Short=Sec synthase; AltName: Full=Selenocysteinyl-tRNA(Sec) synthase [[Mannheimia] succiniciproducens MBEL55E]AAU38945.1 SelA protein [[Mannheimia] succiniciproducens MBEL55E]
MTALFQQLPSVDKILKTPQGEQLVTEFGHSAVVNCCRHLLAQAREKIKIEKKLPHFFTDFNHTIAEVNRYLANQQQVKIKSVHNLTGTVLHTNLGRALWAQSAQQAALTAMRQNVALEYDLEAGKRSHRDNYVSELLHELTGAQAACVVNNNAAAVLLMLATFAQGKEVIISRGELIEIGGAFRIPDIMAQAGCKLVEVGTTNRTHLNDYRRAINENTALLMKVHSSNYQICGFTCEVSEQELVELGKEFNIPVVTDLGSGALTDLSRYDLPKEPTVQEKLVQGADLISFSGDKLLGGPQAGIIVGKKELIQQLQSHPLKRVLRCDKVILAAMEATLRLYLQPEKLTEKLTSLRLLTQPLEQLRQQAEQLKAKLENLLKDDFLLQIESSLAQIGSGSQPMAKIPSIAVTIAEKNSEKLTALLARFKKLSTPIIARVENDKIRLDLRSVTAIETLLITLEELNQDQ